MTGTSATSAWPALGVQDWLATRETLHMWTQIVGKIRMEHSPAVNHWWHVPLYVSPRGLTTSAIPWPGGLFEIRFDFIAHQLRVETSDGLTKRLALAPRTVADFYAELTNVLDSLGIHTEMQARPDEVPDPIPFAEDRVHHSYEPEQARRFWRALVSMEPIFQEFRSRFIGKCSPVHFFWGAFDLAVTRFSGRRAPPRDAADSITKEGYSHECSSVGFWPGGASGVNEPVFYAYMAPEPEGFRDARVSPEGAFYHQGLGEFLLPYDAVRLAPSPRDALLSFMQSSYEAGANLARWDRAALEKPGDGSEVE